MLTLLANNQVLTEGREFSYLINNEASGIAAGTGLIIVNSDVFATDDYVVLGEIGVETTEIMKIASVTAATHTIKFTDATKFAHPESTRITIIKYNQVRFYHTTTDTFSSGRPLAVAQDIQVDDFSTRYYDTTHGTGFGWYTFFNSTTSTHSQPSNPIPYADFAENSVKKILDNFYSLLNTGEVKMITTEEIFQWLNEAHARAQNELNLVNQEFSVPANYEIDVIANTAEYSLPSDFGTLLSITNSNGEQIPNISLRSVKYSDQWNTQTYYYLRGGYIGFTPTPTTVATYDTFYTSITSRLTSLYDNLNYPNNNYYFIVNYLMFKAGLKLKRPDAAAFLKLFEDGVNLLKITAIKQNAARDTWGIEPSANI